MVNMATVKESEQELADRVKELCDLLLTDKRLSPVARGEYIKTIARLNGRRAELRKTLAGETKSSLRYEALVRARSLWHKRLHEATTAADRQIIMERIEAIEAGIRSVDPEY